MCIIHTLLYMYYIINIFVLIRVLIKPYKHTHDSSEWIVLIVSTTDHWPLTTDHWPLTTDYWALTIDHWPRTTEHWPLTIGHWSLVTDDLIWSVIGVIHRCPIMGVSISGRVYDGASRRVHYGENEWGECLFLEWAWSVCEMGVVYTRNGRGDDIKRS